MDEKVFQHWEFPLLCGLGISIEDSKLLISNMSSSNFKDANPLED